MSEPHDDTGSDPQVPRWDQDGKPTFGEALTAPLADDGEPLPQQPRVPASPLLDQPVRLRLGDGRWLEFDGVQITIRSDRPTAKDYGQEMIPLRQIAAIGINYNSQADNDKQPELRIELATGRTRSVEFTVGFNKEAEQFQRAVSRGIALLEAGHVPTPEVSRQIAEEMGKRNINWAGLITVCFIFAVLLWFIFWAPR